MNLANKSNPERFQIKCFQIKIKNKLQLTSDKRQKCKSVPNSLSLIMSTFGNSHTIFCVKFFKQ